MPHVSCNKCREQTAFNGSVGQGISLSVSYHVQAFHVNNPPLVHPSLTHPVTHLIVERKAHFIVTVSMAICLLLGFGYYNKEMCFYPQFFFFFSSHCSFCLDFLLPPLPCGSFPNLLLTQASCAWEGCFASPLWAPLVFGRLLCPIFLLPLTLKLRALPREGGRVWLCRHAHGGQEVAECH